MENQVFVPNKARRLTANAVSATCGVAHLSLTVAAVATANIEAALVSRLLKRDPNEVKAARVAETSAKIARASLAIKVLKGQTV